jgi:hypothetical protein
MRGISLFILMRLGNFDGIHREGLKQVVHIGSAEFVECIHVGPISTEFVTFAACDTSSSTI